MPVGYQYSKWLLLTLSLSYMNVDKWNQFWNCKCKMKKYIFEKEKIKKKFKMWGVPRKWCFCMHFRFYVWVSLLRFEFEFEKPLSVQSQHACSHFTKFHCGKFSKVYMYVKSGCETNLYEDYLWKTYIISKLTRNFSKQSCIFLLQCFHMNTRWQYCISKSNGVGCIGCLKLISNMRKTLKSFAL